MAEYQSTFKGAEIDDAITKARSTQQLITYCETSTTATRNYSIGDLVIVGNVLYEVTAAIASGETISASNTESVSVADVLQNLDDVKADKNGTILMSENTKQIASDVRVKDSVPYVFRTAGGSVEIGNRAFIDKIIGGTVVWNQLAGLAAANYSLTRVSLSSSDTIITLSSTTDTSGIKKAKVSIITDHVYLASGAVRANESGSPYAYLGFAASSESSRKTIASTENAAYASGSGLFKAGSGDQFVLKMQNATPSGTSFQFEGVQLIDITQMFGSAIADYIYSLETANSGAGIAYFKKLFPKEYYAYNAGQLMSVKTSAHVTTGFNAFNYSAGTAKLVGGMQYQITGTYTALSYSTGETITPDADGYFTPTENGTLTVTGGDSTTTCVHLVWDGERDDDFEAYSAHNYPLDSDLELRGIPKLDANNALYYVGDEYAPDGTVKRKFADVNIGSLTWETFTYGFRCAISNFPNIVRPAANIVPNAVCSAYPVGAIPQSSADMDDGTIGVGRSGVNYIYIKDSSISTVEALMEKISGAHFVYELTTPTAEIADPYTSPQEVDNWGTEEFTDDGTRDVTIPVGHETGYPQDLRAKLEAVPDSPSDDGDYIMRRTSGVNAYAALAKELPAVPTTDGTYTLKCTVSDGTATLSWASES